MSRIIQFSEEYYANLWAKAFAKEIDRQILEDITKKLKLTRSVSGNIVLNMD